MLHLSGTDRQIVDLMLDGLRIENEISNTKGLMDGQMDKDAVFGCFVTQKVYGGTKVVIEKYGQFVFEFFAKWQLANRLSIPGLQFLSFPVLHKFVIKHFVYTPPPPLYFIVI